MFVPLGAPVKALPGLSPGVSLNPDLFVGPSPGTSSSELHLAPSQKSPGKSSSMNPLDLRKSPGRRMTESPAEEERASPATPGRPSSANSLSPPTAKTLKQKEMEVQLQFLKAKQVSRLEKFRFRGFKSLSKGH